jgi:hypothetical protein
MPGTAENRSNRNEEHKLISFIKSSVVGRGVIDISLPPAFVQPLVDFHDRLMFEDFDSPPGSQDVPPDPTP